MAVRSSSISGWSSVASAVAWELAATAAALVVDDGSGELSLSAAESRSLWSMLDEPPRAVPGLVAAFRANAPEGQLDLFAAATPPAAVQAPAINPFEGPCVVCGEPGRRRLTFPAAFAAVMPPVEPTCVQHELVADWAIPLSADEAGRVIRGELLRTPTYRYRAVYGSKAAKQKVATDE